MAFGIFRDPTIVSRCFYSFVLPNLEYCSPVWASAADTHLTLLDRVVRSVLSICPGVAVAPLGHRRKVASLFMFYKIY